MKHQGMGEKQRVQQVNGTGEENRGDWRSNGVRYTNWKEDLRRMRAVSVDSEKQ
jgi:hypothetical protein